jgi:hypothetical protein
MKPSTVLAILAYLADQAVVLLEDIGHKLDRSGL